MHERWALRSGATGADLEAIGLVPDRRLLELSAVHEAEPPLGYAPNQRSSRSASNLRFSAACDASASAIVTLGSGLA